MDKKWWDVMQPDFKGARLTATDNCEHADLAPSMSGKNSGIGALFLARHLGADRIIMLGYDCKPDKNGKRHWHGAHHKNLPDAGSMPSWMYQFEQAAKTLFSVEVINCTRDTALNYWIKQPLEETLCL